MAEKELTARRKLMAAHPDVITNPVKAAIESGYTPNSAKAHAHAIRREIFSDIQVHVRDRLEAAGVTDDKVLGALRDLMDADITSLYKGDVVAGRKFITMKEFDDLTDAQRKLIKEIEFETVSVSEIIHKDIGGGITEPVLVEQPVQVVKKLKLYDRQKAIESLARVMGLDAQQKIAENSPGPSAIDEDLAGLNDYELGLLSKVFRMSRARRARELREAQSERVRIADSIPSTSEER